MTNRRNVGPLLEERMKALGDMLVVPPETLWRMIQRIAEETPATALAIEANLLYHAAKENGHTPLQALDAVNWGALTTLESARREKPILEESVKNILEAALRNQRQELQSAFGEKISLLQVIHTHLLQDREGRDILSELQQKRAARPEIDFSFGDILSRTRIPDRPQLEAGTLLGYLFSSPVYGRNSHGQETLFAYVEPTRRLKKKNEMHHDRQRAEAVAQALSATSERSFNYRPTFKTYQRGWRLGFDSRAILSWTGAFGLTAGTYKSNDPWFSAGMLAGLAAGIGRVEERGKKIYLTLEKFGPATKPYSLTTRARDIIVKSVTSDGENGWLRIYPHLKEWEPAHPAPSADGRRLLFGSHNTSLLSRGEPFANTPFEQIACGFYVRPIDVDRARRHREMS